MSKSTAPGNTEKATKPRPDFPLFPHASGWWAKKVKGRFYYFGKVADDPNGDAALAQWLEQRDYLLAGRRPRSRVAEDATIQYACNHFLAMKDQHVQSGELASRTFERYTTNCKMIVDALGASRAVEDVGPDDFTEMRGRMANRWGPVALANEIQYVRAVFKHAYEAGLLERPVRFGPGFKKPSAKTLRKKRAERGSRMLSRNEISRIRAHATRSFDAMILLGINGALGNTDLAMLPIGAVDLRLGWMDYPRPKTGVPRRIPLWPETVTAIHTYLDERPDPVKPADAHFLFISARGLNFIGKYKGYRVTAAWNRTIKAAGITGRTFYDLRRTFQTVAEGTRDLVAVQSIMGHAPSASDMSSIYRQSIEDARLVAVSNHVRKWLFPPGEDQSAPE